MGWLEQEWREMVTMTARPRYNRWPLELPSIGGEAVRLLPEMTAPL